MPLVAVDPVLLDLVAGRPADRRGDGALDRPAASAELARPRRRRAVPHHGRHAVRHRRDAAASLTVHPTRTIYTFANKRVRITLTFLTPALPWDLDLLSRPITYLTWDIVSADGKPHQVQIYVDCGAEIAVNTPEQSVGLDYPIVDGLAVARMGTADQPVLARRGDDVRIDWGYGYLATPTAPGVVVTGGNGGRLRRAFVTGSALPAPAGPAAPAPVTESRLAMAASWDLGTVGRLPSPAGPCWPTTM